MDPSALLANVSSLSAADAADLWVHASLRASAFLRLAFGVPPIPATTAAVCAIYGKALAWRRLARACAAVALAGAPS